MDRAEDVVLFCVLAFITTFLLVLFIKSVVQSPQYPPLLGPHQ